MNYIYGQVRASKGGIPVGGSDAAYAWGVFTAAENPVEIVAGTYRSGDSGEFYTLAIVPPDFPSLDGNTLIAGGDQGVMALGDVRGGGETIVNPGALYDSSQMAITQRIIVPPFHHVVTFCSTPSAADFRVYFLGMDLVKP
jgi:hypothetical protein